MYCLQTSENLKQYYASCFSLIAGIIIFGGLLAPTVSYFCTKSLWLILSMIHTQYIWCSCIFSLYVCVCVFVFLHVILFWRNCVPGHEILYHSLYFTFFNIYPPPFSFLLFKGWFLVKFLLEFSGKYNILIMFTSLIRPLYMYLSYIEERNYYSAAMGGHQRKCFQLTYSLHVVWKLDVVC